MRRSLFKRKDKRDKNLRELSSKSVMVIGAINLDIIGTASFIKNGDSSSGNINIQSGGVGRNVVENLARIGVPVKFVSSTADDWFGKRAIEEIYDLGVEVNMIKRMAGKKSSMYMLVSSLDQSETYAIDDMEVMSMIDTKWINSISNEIENADYVIIDCNIKHSALQELTTIKGLKLLVAPATASKVKLISTHISFVHTLFISINELDALTDVKTRTEQDLYENILSLHDKGVTYVVVKSDYKNIYASDGYRVKKYSLVNLNFVNGVGARDVFVAAFTTNLLSDKSFDDCVVAGLAAYKNNVETNASIIKNISYDAVQSWVSEIIYEESVVSY